jgi:hypothetical protein
LSRGETNHMRYVLFVITALFLTACDPCRNLDCVTDDYEGQFRILRSSDGADLLFGPQKSYTADSIRFYTLQNGDTTFLESKAAYFTGATYDSILQVRFFPKADTAYMRLPNGDVDTLQLTYETRNTRCCGTITELTNIRFNNTTDLSGKGIQEIRK